MNELTVFENAAFGELRTVEREGETWFCLRDVCEPLGLRVRDVKERLKTEGVDTIALLTNGGMQQAIFIDEPNLYRVIFQSRKAEAERFMDWVTEEVLPSIRKTGRYEAKHMTAAEMLAAQANLLVEMEARQTRLKQRLNTALTALAAPREDRWTEDMKEAIAQYCTASGLTDAAGRGRLYAALDHEAKCNTDARLRHLRARKKSAGEKRREYMAYTKLDAVALDKQLRSPLKGSWRGKK